MIAAFLSSFFVNNRFLDFFFKQKHSPKSKNNKFDIYDAPEDAEHVVLRYYTPYAKLNVFSFL